MSAIFMSHHRFSTINPDDIARIGTRLSLNSISFKPITEHDEDADDAYAEGPPLDEEQGFVDGKRKRSARGSLKRGSKWRRLKLKWTLLSQRYGLNHVIPILLLVLYSIIGALIFSAVELPRAEEKFAEKITKLEKNRRWVANSMIAGLNIRNNTRNYRIMLTILEQSDANNRLLMREPMTWDIWGALFYVGTIYTTIGYGNIYPETTLGYALTIIYAFFGVPLVLAILSDIGQQLAKWSSIIWRRVASRVSDEEKKMKSSTDLLMPESGVPVSLCLLLTFSWLLLCSALFCTWEDWSYFTAFYFFFISLSTIGLGDVVPADPKVMIFTFGFVLIGLCLVSMTLGVVQEHIALFLYRMMIEMQKECEAMLANGEDVDKKALLEKIWENKPWYMRKFMPSFISDVQTERLEDFAGTTITDTAVNMGLIPPPPGYRPGLAPAAAMSRIHLPTPRAVESASMENNAAGKGEPNAKQGRSSLKPARDKAKKHDFMDSLQSASSSLLAPMLAGQQAQQKQRLSVSPQQRPASMEDLYPGGRVVIKRSNSCRDRSQEQLERALRTRVVSTQTVNEDLSPSPTACVQTDLMGTDLMDVGVKRDTVSTLSLASWYEEDESMPFSMNQLDKLTAEEVRHLPVIAKMLPLVSSAPAKKLIEASVQTDDQPDVESLSSSSEDFVSAVETKSIISPPSRRFSSKLVQTVPVLGLLASKVPNYSVEVQTEVPNCCNAEIQTSSAQCSNAEVQCQPQDTDDEEAQTSLSEQVPLPTRPDLLPRSSSSEVFLDKCIQTECAQMRSLEMQTDLLLGDSVETQTDLQIRPSSISQRGSVIDENKQRRARIKEDSVVDEEDLPEEVEQYVVTDASGNKNPGWLYSSWVSNEDIDQEHSSEDDEEMSDESLREEMDFDPDLIDFEGDTEESESEGIDLPAVTVAKFVERAMVDAATWMDEDGRKSSRASRCSRHSTREEAITACIATQTEEIITRRQSFPRDVFTSRFRSIKFDETDRDDKKGHGLLHWLTHRTKRAKSSADTGDHKILICAPNEHVAVQTDNSEMVRDILIQTDDSFLMRAKKFESLRAHRTKSLAVAVAPHLRQKLNKMVAATSGTTVVVNAQSAGEGSKGKRGSRK